MATFPSFTPTYSGFRKKSNPIVRNVRFADGYEHRVLFGLASHQSPKVYNLEFNESEENADVIEAFLESRELGLVLSAAIQAQLVQEKRPGGLLA